MRAADVVVYDRLVGPGVLDLVPDARRADLRRQDARSPRLPAGRHQPAAGRAGARRQARAPAQGRRSVHLRPRRRGARGAGRRRHPVPGGAGRHRGDRLRGLRRHPADPSRSRRRRWCSSPATPRTASPISTGRRSPGPARRWSVYMGIKALAGLCRRLIEHGLPAATPAALIENGTYDHQRIVDRHARERCRERVPDLRLAGPSLIIVGEVVALGRRWLAGACGPGGRGAERRRLSRALDDRAAAGSGCGQGRQPATAREAGMRLVQFIAADERRRVGRVGEDGRTVARAARRRQRLRARAQRAAGRPPARRARRRGAGRRRGGARRRCSPRAACWRRSTIPTRRIA